MRPPRKAAEYFVTGYFRLAAMSVEAVRGQSSRLIFAPGLTILKLSL
jgi:hypothetical protein